METKPTTISEKEYEEIADYVDCPNCKEPMLSSYKDGYAEAHKRFTKYLHKELDIVVAEYFGGECTNDLLAQQIELLNFQEIYRMETKELITVEKQYSNLEQSQQMFELGMNQSEALAYWFKRPETNEWVLFQTSQLSDYHFQERQVLFSERIGKEKVYKAFSIQQMEEFVFNSLEWVHKNSNTDNVYLNTVYNQLYDEEWQIISLPKRSKIYSEFEVQLGLKDTSYWTPDSGDVYDYEEVILTFPTLAQAYAALCIYILQNFKAPEQCTP